MNPAVTALRRIHGERRPEDSGEWRPTKPAFKFLDNRTPPPDRTRRAQLIVASVIALAVNALVAWLAWDRCVATLVAAVVGPAPGIAIGLLWLAQFGELRGDRAVRVAIAWTFSLLIPAAGLVAYVAVQVGAGSAVWTACVCISAVVAWCLPSFFTAIAAFRIAGGRP